MDQSPQAEPRQAQVTQLPSRQHQAPQSSVDQSQFSHPLDQAHQAQAHQAQAHQPHVGQAQAEYTQPSYFQSTHPQSSQSPVTEDEAETAQWRNAPAPTDPPAFPAASPVTGTGIGEDWQEGLTAATSTADGGTVDGSTADGGTVDGSTADGSAASGTPAYQPERAAQLGSALPSFLEQGPELDEFPHEPDLPDPERPRTHRYTGGHAFQRPGRGRRARAAAAAAGESADSAALPGESRGRGSESASHARSVVDPSRRLADPRQAQVRSWTSTSVPYDDPGPASSEDHQDETS